MQRLRIEHSTVALASPKEVWREVTLVDITGVGHPKYLSLLGIPQPLRAEVVQPGVGGARIAYFSNGLRFSQEITAWDPPIYYAFTFKPDPGFRVGYFLDLSDGPFLMKAGAYRMTPAGEGTRISLSSDYELNGIMGLLLRVPVRIVLHLFQSHLLKGIRANAERRAGKRNERD